MKRLLLILLCLPMIGFGQDDEITTLQNQVEDINYRMDKHHKQYMTGATISVVGMAVVTLGIAITVPVISIVGSAAAIAGGITMMNSHKWFKELIITENWKIKKIKKLENRKIELKDLLKSGKINQKEYDEEINKMDKYILQLKQ